MRQPWLIKASAFQILRFCPQSFYEFLTVNVSGRGNRTISAAYLEDAQRHADLISQEIDLEKETVLEFGAGRDLLNNLLFVAKGFKKQIAVDAVCLVNASHLNSIKNQKPLNSLKLTDFSNNFVDELKGFGITYLAPIDMRNTQFASDSIAAVTSTNTLEHIPRDDVMLIMMECFRILRKGGICSFKIDYSDHYSHTDSKISHYNFLSFSESRWKLLSPPNHFQNRLRHVDFINIFKRAGFRIELQEESRGESWERELGHVQINDAFSRYSKDELSATSGWVLLRKP